MAKKLCASIEIGSREAEREPPGANLTLLAPVLDECPPDRDRNPRCFNGLPYRCGFPQVKIVCQQIRGHSVHNFAVAKSLTQSLSWAAWHSKRQRTPHHTPRGPRPSVTRRHRLLRRRFWGTFGRPGCALNRPTWSPIKGSSASVSTIRSAIVVRQRFFGIFWPVFWPAPSG